MNESERRAYSVAFNVVVTFAVIILAFNLGNYLQLSFPVMGSSMLPAIHTGDLALVQPVQDASLIHVGDVVVYRAGGINVIHRVVKVQAVGGDTVLTVKGDNNRYADPVPVTSNLLVGKVVTVVQYLGTFVQPPYNYVVAFVLIVLLVVDYMDAGRAREGPRAPETSTPPTHPGGGFQQGPG